MSELVVMPKIDWVAILNSVRAKTYSDDPIKSGELAAILDNLSTLDFGASFTKFATGTVTLTSDVMQAEGDGDPGKVPDFQIEHGLGERPNFYFLFAEKDIASTTVERRIFFEIAVRIPGNPTSSGGIWGRGSWWSSGVTNCTSGYIQSDNTVGQGPDYLFLSDVFTESHIKFHLGYDEGFPAGQRYHWMCGATNQG